jgi:tetratricopeptide (TPR) repeat protein
MRSLVGCLVGVAIILSAAIAQSQTLDEYVKKTEDYRKSDRLEQAARTMEEAIKEYPDDSTAYSYLGLYLGMQAGRTSDFMEAGRLIGKSFEMLDKAVSLDPHDPLARYHRGLMGVNVPEFLGKLEIGIKDLESLVEISEQSPDEVARDILVSAYDLLGQGYQKKKEKQKARLAWEKVIELAPRTNLAKKAEGNIKKISEAKQPQPEKEKQPDSATIANLKQKVEKEPGNPHLLLELGKAYADARDFEEAEKVLKKVIDIDPTNLEAYKRLVSVLGELAAKGYDERIHEDTELRTNLAFEVVRVLDKAVELAPEDTEIRLLRGIIGVEMPFFVGKLDQAMDDLNRVIKSDAPDSTKADALYWLGAAYQKKAMTHWIKVISHYPDSEASMNAFEQMRPAVKRLDISKYQTPILTIDFVLGFRDELPPQTAIWVEGKDGQFVKTIYVSGFSGYAKEQQVNLPEWAESSEFADVDGVTGASIDVGHHIYVWDLKNNSGEKVGTGEYVIKVEVHYWPSTQYQLASATLKIGEKEEQEVIEEGNLIPYLEIRYYPR